MGGQETLLLLARHPELLAGAAAFDSVADLARQYRSFPRDPVRQGVPEDVARPGRAEPPVARARRRSAARRASRPLAYALRSPVTYARSIAASCVPLQLWWSVSDRIVVEPASPVGRALQEDQAAEPEGAGSGLRRLLDALERDAGEDPAAARARERSGSCPRSSPSSPAASTTCRGRSRHARVGGGPPDDRAGDDRRGDVVAAPARLGRGSSGRLREHGVRGRRGAARSTPAVSVSSPATT